MSCLGYVSLGFVLYRICLEGDKGASLSPPRLKKNKKRKEQMTNIKNASPNNVFVLVMGGGDSVNSIMKTQNPQHIPNRHYMSVIPEPFPRGY